MFKRFKLSHQNVRKGVKSRFKTKGPHTPHVHTLRIGESGFLGTAKMLCCVGISLSSRTKESIGSEQEYTALSAALSARCNKLPICPLVESNLQAFQELNETAEPENRIQEWLNGEKNKNKFFQSLRNVLKRYFSRANEEVSFQHLNDQNWLQLCSSCKSGFSDFN